MAKISKLPLALAGDGTEALPFVQGGVTRRLSLGGFIGAATPFLQDCYKGDKGDPGGSPEAIGLFAIAHTLDIRDGIDLVQTSGNRCCLCSGAPAHCLRLKERPRLRDQRNRRRSANEGGDGGAADDTDAVQAAIDTGRDTIFTQMHAVVALHRRTAASQ